MGNLLRRIWLASMAFAFAAGCPDALADGDPFTSQASFIGGAGSTATNLEYTLVSSWRQQTQTSISVGGDYANASGFLGILSDVSGAPTGFSILSVEMQIGTTNHFRITIPTTPGYSYLVQFTDTLSPTSSAWQQFQNTNEGVGSHFETNSSPSLFTFADDFTPATSGSAPASAARYYRIVFTAP